MNRKKPRGIGGQGRGLLDRDDVCFNKYEDQDGGEMMAKPFREMCTGGDVTGTQENNDSPAPSFQQRGTHVINYDNYTGEIPPEQRGPERREDGNNRQRTQK